MLFAAMHTVIPPTLRAVLRPRIEGAEHVPLTGPVLLASNHLSFVDSVVIPVAAPRKVVFLAKAEYFTGTGLRGRISRGWFEGLGMIPVDRTDSRSALDSLETALEVLRRGEAFGLYPEGTRSRDGRLYRGRTGVAQLALRSGAPIVPVGLLGTDRLQPIGARLPRPARVTVRFGEPLDVTGQYAGMPPGRARRLITDEVMERIQALTGQQPAGSYNEQPPAD
jgi:1-acyl-sn-glycerol-3-phosphate acyltransferase